MAQEHWPAIVEALNALFNIYLELPSQQLDGEITIAQKWSRARDVSMRTFAHYHFGKMLASVAQIARRIERYIAPFDEDLRKVIGLSATDALRIANWISVDLQHRGDRTQAAYIAAKRVHTDALRASRSTLEMRLATRTPAAVAAATELSIAAAGLFKVERSALIANFGNAGELFWEVFSTSRGATPPIVYPTENGIARVRPLVCLKEDQAMVVSPNTVFHALLTVAEDALRKSSVSHSYFAHRDTMLEKESVDQFLRILGQESTVYQSVFEQADDQYEHDAIITIGKVVFIVESKASPPREPFRDPERAFRRMYDGFRGEGGIQKAFDQASRIKRRLDSGERVELFARGGELVGVLDPAALHKVYCVGVTRDDFGALSTDLTLMLEKKRTDPYPWMVNILDLEAIADAWTYLNWGLPALTSYLNQRLQLHGRVHSNDELDFVGCYIRHGSFESATSISQDFVVLDPHYSEYFDELYAHQYHGQSAPVSNVGAMVVTDFQSSVQAGEPVFIPTRVARQPGRNDPCSCGSGEKYKKCHGAPHRA